MNKTELVRRIAEREGLDRGHAKQIVDSVFREMAEAMQRGEFVALREFGRFNVKERKGRKGQDPRTGRKIDIPAARTISFTIAKALKEAMNG